MALDDNAARAFRKAGAANVTVWAGWRNPARRCPITNPNAPTSRNWWPPDRFGLPPPSPPPKRPPSSLPTARPCGLAHRLLLILVPQDPNRGADLAARLEAEEGWTVALRSREQEPDTETEVYIPDSSAEYGLWYRLAPVTFLGGSLLGDGCDRNPMEAAALGSAIIYGPRPGSYGPLFGRLGAARAARAVGAAADLGDAISDLLAPDRAARLAQSAWALSSDGVELTDHVIEFTRQVLDGKD